MPVAPKPTLADLIDEAEVDALSRCHGRGTVEREAVTVEMYPKEFADWRDAVMVKRNRRGEVVLVLQRPDGQVLLHTKAFYPRGTFRLLTGGIHYGEPVLEAAVREAAEETGLAITPDRYLGLVAYDLRHGARRLPFASYLVLAQVDGQPPVLQDTDEEITEFRYTPVVHLPQIAADLRGLPGKWACWGAMRAPAHEMVARLLADG